MNIFERWQHRLSNTQVIGDGTWPLPYMLRWEILRFLGMTVKVHVFMKSDRDCHHDHPWSFLTLVVGGRYVEEILNEDGTTKQVTRKPMTIAYRKAEHKHRVLLIDEKPCLTIVLTFRRSRDWGFWSNGNFINWESFLQQKPSIRCE